MADIPLELLAAHANSFASSNGIQVERRRHDGDGSSYFECAPMSLLPNAYPKQAFEQATTVAPAFNELVDRVSRDSQFLEQTLGGGVSDTDPYTAKILQLYKQVYCNTDDDAESANTSPAHLADRLGIHRSDYMLHAGGSSDEDKASGTSYQLKQVELNTIAASFAGLAVNVARLHTYLTQRFETETTKFLQANKEIVSSSSSTNDGGEGVPENPALSKIPLAMKVAHQRYVERFTNGQNRENVIVLFVVQEGETNTVDQRMLEFKLWEDHQIPVVRMSLTKAHTAITVDESTGALKLGDQEIAVVYYRAGYAPTDYPDGDDGIEWQARLKIEQSRAAKCPSLGYHLAGTKKVQQELARPGVLERFFPKEDEASKVHNMRASFAGLYSLGEDAEPQDIAVVQAVLQDNKQGNYVLKPQREGGGYNFYGDDLATKLRDNTSVDDGKLQLGDKLREYILMERLFPPQQRAVLLRGGKVEGSGDSVSELGCYGTLVVDSDGQVVHNEYAGFLLRTKFSNVDEGGVASGFATLSSPYLC